MTAAPAEYPGYPPRYPGDPFGRVPPPPPEPPPPAPF